MPELEPITREEKLLDGEDLTPITRKEMFIKRIYDKTQSVPEPITREEMFLKKAGEGGGGDVTIEQLDVSENGTYSESGKAYSPVVVNVPQPTLTTLDVTENGTYTAPSGTAYNEVDVNVPLPENAYLLEEYEDVPTDIASFTASDAPLKSLTASIVPVQAGSGDPSPTNVRPITGWTEEVVSVCGVNIWDEEWEIGTISTSTGEYSPSGDRVCTKNYIRVEPNELYYKQNFAWQFYYDEYKNFISATSIADGVFTTPNNAHYMKFYTSSAYGQTYNNDISINYPSTDTEYHAYSGTTTTIPFTDSQGQSVEVFGGSVDVVNGGEQPNPLGKIIVDENTDVKIYGGWRFYFDVPNFASPAYNVVANILCDKLVTRTKNSMPQLNSISAYDTGGARMIISVSDTITTIEDMKAWLANNPLEIVYELATPTTFYTQPTSIKSLDGENNVFASTGQIESLEFFTKEAE